MVDNKNEQTSPIQGQAAHDELPAQRGDMTPGLQPQVPTGTPTEGAQEVPTSNFRRMTHEDRIESYNAQMRAYADWVAAKDRPGGFYRIPKHPDDADREYEEAQERRSKELKSRPRGVQLIGHLIFPRH